MQYHIRTKDGVKGPFTDEQISSFVASGKLPATAKIKRSDGQIVEAGSLSGGGANEAVAEAAAAEDGRPVAPEPGAQGREWASNWVAEIFSRWNLRIALAILVSPLFCLFIMVVIFIETPRYLENGLAKAGAVAVLLALTAAIVGYFVYLQRQCRAHARS